VDKGTELNINAQGLENSNREHRNGKVYFGAYETHHGIVVNDFVIPLAKETPGSNKGRFF